VLGNWSPAHGVNSFSPLDHGRRHSHSFHSFLGWWVHNSNSWLWWKIIKKLFIISWCLPLEGWTWCSAGVSICLPLKFVRFTLAAFVQPYVCVLAVDKFHATFSIVCVHMSDFWLTICLDLLNGNQTHFLVYLSIYHIFHYLCRMEALKKNSPVSVPEGLSGLQKSAVLVEEKMYTAATSRVF